MTAPFGPRSQMLYGALPSPFAARAAAVAAPADPCPWCYKDAGLPWPSHNPSSTICLRHSALLRARRKAADAE